MKKLVENKNKENNKNYVLISDSDNNSSSTEMLTSCNSKDKTVEDRGVCFDFLRGECTRGHYCRFNHDLKMIATKYKVLPFFLLKYLNLYYLKLYLK